MSQHTHKSPIPDNAIKFFQGERGKYTEPYQHFFDEALKALQHWDMMKKFAGAAPSQEAAI